MVSSAVFREEIVSDPANALYGFDLSGLEYLRLVTIAAQRGMRVNTAIHRANRLTPLDQTMPFSCLILSDQLHEIVDRYWEENPTKNLQLPAECERFAEFLERLIGNGEIRDPYLADVITFERTCTKLRFFPEPSVQVVTFRHDPEVLLSALSQRKMPPADITSGIFHLAIDCRSGSPVFRLIDQAAFNQLQQLAA